MGDMVELLGLWGAAGIGGAAVLLALRFVLRKFSDESAAAQMSEAKKDVIKMLRSEIARCSEHREKIAALSSEIAGLYVEILDLKKSNSELKAELSKLGADNAALKSELARVAGEWRTNGQGR